MKDTMNANMKDLLKVGGRLIFLVPAHGQLYSQFDKKLGHFRRYSKSAVLAKLKNADFKAFTSACGNPALW